MKTHAGMMQLKKEVFELNETYNKVLHWFFSFPSMETSLNDLSVDLKLSKTTAKRVVNRLVKEDFLIKKVYGRTWIITCAKNHPYLLTKKIAFNLENVSRLYYVGGLREDLRKYVKNPQAVILFGSYRKGDDTDKSDIDIAIEVIGNQETKIISEGMFKQPGYRRDVPVNLHIFSRKKVDLNLFANIANGIVLEGFLEVRP